MAAFRHQIQPNKRAIQTVLSKQGGMSTRISSANFCKCKLDLNHLAIKARAASLDQVGGLVCTNNSRKLDCKR